MCKKSYLLLLFIFLGLRILAQEAGSPLKIKKAQINECTLVLDSLTLVPKSVRIIVEGQEVKDFNYENNSIVFQNCESVFNKEATITYRTFPFDLEHKYFHLDSAMMTTKDQAISIGTDYTNPNKNRIINSDGLDYNGSFSRGFSVGNSQSLILNSNFNLQLAGELGNGIKVVAAISDESIPIQPEGNTQQIQEFDRVFIKVSRKKSSVIAGDYILQKPKAHFVNYFKKLKGISLSNSSDIGEKHTLTTNGSFAISRGKFARQTLLNTEGNQGPYKLTGANGERFLIVLSGSEKVYFDGILLTRGLDYDYVIDYNRAEITFTPKRIVARESRIIVEYEYRDQNYLRSVYAANAYYSTPKYDFNFNFYNEQDSKNSTGDLVLDSTDINLLTSIGDDLSQAQVSSLRLAIDSLTLPGQIRYRLNPNILPGDPDPVYLEYSADVLEDLYFASFSEVGENKGRYSIDDDSPVNGRVYKYVGPNNGSYEPTTQLIPPEKKQIMSFGGNFRPRENIKFKSELSLSNKDINRFADLGNDNNQGLAAMLGYNHEIDLNSRKNYSLFADLQYETLDENFTFLNPYRNAEFNRDWNVGNKVTSGRQQLLKSTLAVHLSDSLKTSYTLGIFDVEGQYTGYNQTGKAAYVIGGFNLLANIRSLSSDGFGEKTSFVRPNINVSQLLHKSSGFRIGVEYDGEKNRRENNNSSGALLLDSYSFDVYKAYIENNKEGRLQYRFQYSYRDDFFPEEEDLTKSISTKEISSNVKWAITPSHGLNINFGYRNFSVLRAELSPTPISNKATIVGKLDHNISIKKGFILSNTSYIINSGQEPKVEFYFEKVEEGQGDYIYIGNQDSVLINANFRYAPNLGTGNYIRLSLINNEFVITNNQNLSQSLRIEPKKLFAKSKQKWAKLLAKFSTISTFRIGKKIEDDGSNQESSFLNFSTNSTDLVSYNSLINNTLFFNRGQAAYDLQLGYKSSDNIFTQISGLEQRSNREWLARSRVKIFQSSDVILEVRKGNRGYDSALFEDRNLDIEYYEINPQISLRPRASMRFIIEYSFEKRDQVINNLETAKNHTFTFNSTIRQASNSNLNFSLSYVNVLFDGIENSPLEFDLLAGLKNGKNYLWNTLFTKRLANNIDLNLSYEGRKNGSNTTVHIARAQVKATF